MAMAEKMVELSEITDGNDGNDGYVTPDINKAPQKRKSLDAIQLRDYRENMLNKISKEHVDQIVYMLNVSISKSPLEGNFLVAYGNPLRRKLLDRYAIELRKRSFKPWKKGQKVKRGKFYFYFDEKGVNFVF